MQTDAGLATAMRISITRLARRLRVERLGLGGSEAILSDIQLAALAALERHDAMTPGELAEHEKVQPPSMTRVIAVLEERGLVRRAAHPTDRRQVILTVTQQGRDLVQLVRRRREAWLAQRLQELTPAERATLLAAAPILEKLSQSLGRPGAASRSPASRTAAARRACCGSGRSPQRSSPAPGSRRGGDDLAHVDRGAAAGEGQVRGEPAVGVAAARCRPCARRRTPSPRGRRARGGRRTCRSTARWPGPDWRTRPRPPR